MLTAMKVLYVCLMQVLTLENVVAINSVCVMYHVFECLHIGSAHQYNLWIMALKYSKVLNAESFGVFYCDGK